MPPKKIEETIKAREAEIVAVRAAFEQEKARIQKIVDGWNQYGTEAQLKVTHLEGCISELRRQLPKTADQKKSERKKKK